MKQVRGIWFPDDEQYFIKEKLVLGSPEFAGAGTYQLNKLMACMPYVKNFRHAVDVGAHVGLWSRVLARMFTKLTAFEPVPAHFECLMRNVLPNSDEVRLCQLALGDRVGEATVASVIQASGNTRIEHDGENTALRYGKAGVIFGPPERVNMDRLDRLRLHNEEIDFLKIDVEGYEYFVLKGGMQTIRKHRPVIIIEQKPGKGAQYGLPDTAACIMLESWGAKLVAAMGGDYIYSWNKS